MAECIPYEIERGNNVIALEVEYTLVPFRPAQLYGLPEDCYPAEGGDVEELNAYFDGQKFDLTRDEETEIERYIARTHVYED